MWIELFKVLGNGIMLAIFEIVEQTKPITNIPFRQPKKSNCQKDKRKRENNDPVNASEHDADHNKEKYAASMFP